MPPGSISTSTPARGHCPSISMARSLSRPARRASKARSFWPFPPGLKASGDVPITPWRIAARIKADPAAARLEQVEASYGTEESALKFAGTGEMRFGLSPLLRAALSARQLDADRFVARDNNAAEPVRVLPALRALLSGIPQAPIAAQIELNSEQVHAGRASAAGRCGRVPYRLEILDRPPSGFSRTRRNAGVAGRDRRASQSVR